jgi:hypothetical protein
MKSSCSAAVLVLLVGSLHLCAQTASSPVAGYTPRANRAKTRRTGDDHLFNDGKPPDCGGRRLGSFGWAGSLHCFWLLFFGLSYFKGRR